MKPKTSSLVLAVVFALLGVGEFINFAVGGPAHTPDSAYNAGYNSGKPLAIVLGLVFLYAAWNRFRTWERSRR